MGYNVTMSRLSIEKVPDELRRQFKVWCIRKGSTMQKEIIRFMKRVLEEDVKEGMKEK